ncbi:hypothetical protein B841_09245 [Corynebacterium maris DSM 45190]|uniref:Secreted protein n=1 Tax=Corynebacterium maris DSM 45190 TaxID=1224163 RepID=S5SW60_9CORY|nr:hypothetical protein [Corynebacterium maris]AGS35322.1 hypothetical protein B841_09245 [Corynebacterium maris DSM 45190]
MFSYLAVFRRQGVVLLAAALAAPLLLAACNTPRQVEPAQATSAQTSEPANTEALPPDAALGEDLVLGCSPAMPCEVGFRVDDIRVSLSCEEGRSDFHAPVGEGRLLITVEGEATAVRTAQDEHFHTFRRPSFEDALGPIEDAAMTSPCRASEQEKWTHPLEEGQTRPLGQTWVMPAQAEYMVLGRHRFEVPELT